VAKKPPTLPTPIKNKSNKKETFFIKPLFLMTDSSKDIGSHIIAFAKGDYNKAIGESLIDAKNDAEAISWLSMRSATKVPKMTQSSGRIHHINGLSEL
jgi:DNA transposition AAA+ family ATPase